LTLQPQRRAGDGNAVQVFTNGWAKKYVSVGTKRISLEQLRRVLGLESVKDAKGSIISYRRLRYRFGRIFAKERWILRYWRSPRRLTINCGQVSFDRSTGRQTHGGWFWPATMVIVLALWSRKGLESATKRMDLKVISDQSPFSVHGQRGARRRFWQSAAKDLPNAAT
jgi:hypothetical protein